MLVSIGLLVALIATAAVALGQTDPPSSGDWTVEDSTYYDSDVTLTGNLTVNGTLGALKLEDMTLTMAGASDGALTILVGDDASLELVNVNIKSTSGSVHYWFIAYGKTIIQGSDIRDVASNTIRWNLWDNIVGGVQIYNSSSVLANSKFHDNQRINVYVADASPEISDCEFYNSEYVSTHTVTTYSYQYRTYVYGWYVDATGLYLQNADPNITGCLFNNNGIRSSALPFFTTSYSINGVMTYGRGILAHNSAPNITKSRFLYNGDQPDDRTVSGVQQIFFDHFFYDDAYEGGLVTIGNGAHPIVTDSAFDFNDVFGVRGGDGGYPTILDRCTFNGNKYIRGSTVYSPSGSIYIEAGSGTMTIANTSCSENLVLANVWVTDVAVHLINYTNSDNRVDNAYNVYLGSGKHRIIDSYLDGNPGLAINVYVAYGRNAQKIRIEGTKIIGADYGIYVSNWNGAMISMANSSILSPDSATFYLQSTQVDAINCTWSNFRVEGYTYGRGSTVRIMYYLDIKVTWQNFIEIPGAFVQVFNSSGEFVYGGITDENGTIGPLVVTSRTILLSGGYQTEFSNSPLDFVAYSSTLKAEVKDLTFDRNQFVLIKVYDTLKPTIYIFSPSDGQAFNTTRVEIRGMSTDVGAGINATLVSIDRLNWETAGSEEQTWFVSMTLKEGFNDIIIKSIDRAGNIREKTLKDIQVDLTPPSLEVLDPVKDVWATSAPNYTLRGRVSDDMELKSLIINRQTVEVDSEGFWSSTQDINSGSNEFTITATDHVDNMVVIVKVIVQDEYEPKLILTSPENGIWTNISQVEVKGITEIGATIRVNGQPVPTFGGRFATTVFLTEGLNRIIVQAADIANNIEREIREVHLDSIPPLLRIESPLGDILTNDPMLTIRGTLDDPSVSHVVVNGLLVPSVGLAFSKDFRLDEGLNPINVEVWDGAQNYATRNFMVTLDSTPPQLELLEPSVLTISTEPTIRIRGRVEAGVDFFMWGEPEHKDFDTINIIRLENTFRYDEYPLVEGINTIYLEAEDDVGNIARIIMVVNYDLEPPELVIYPLVEETFNEIVEVRGILLDGDEVLINDIPVVLDDSGEFIEPVHLQRGKNSLKVVAFDAAGNKVTETVNVTRAKVEPAPEGILGASVGISALLVVIMLVLGLAILYPGATAQAIEPEAMVGEPIIVDTVTGEPIEEESPPAKPPEQPPERPRERPLPPPPPPDEGGETPRRRPLPPPPPDHTEEPDSPPTPPWR
jgi:hypothetical protein